MDFDFGSAIEELEQIARYLENSEINLDEAMKKYERGVELAKKLKAYLKEAENKVKTLQASFEKE